MLGTTNEPTTKSGSGSNEKKRPESLTTGSSQQRSRDVASSLNCKREQALVQPDNVPPVPGSGSPGYREQTGYNWIECLKKSFPSKSQNHWECPPPEILPTQSCFPFSKEPKNQTHQLEGHASLSPARDLSRQRSSKHLDEGTELAAWDVPAVPTLWCPVERLEK